MTQPVTGKEDIVDRITDDDLHKAIVYFEMGDGMQKVIHEGDILLALVELQSRRSSGGERGDVIEECARVLDAAATEWDEVHDDQDYAAAMRRAAVLVRSLREAGGGP